MTIPVDTLKAAEDSIRTMLGQQFGGKIVFDPVRVEATTDHYGKGWRISGGGLPRQTGRADQSVLLCCLLEILWTRQNSQIPPHIRFDLLVCC